MTKPITIPCWSMTNFDGSISCHIIGCYLYRYSTDHWSWNEKKVNQIFPNDSRGFVWSTHIKDRLPYVAFSCTNNSGFKCITYLVSVYNRYNIPKNLIQWISVEFFDEKNIIENTALNIFACQTQGVYKWLMKS